MKTSNILLLALSMGLLAACSGATVGAEFDGRSFKVMAITVDGKDVDMVGDHQPTMSFTDGRVSGNNGCNTYGGVALIGDGTFRLDQVSQTEMACLETDHIEAAFNQAISVVTTWERKGDGTYVLRSDDGATTMTLVRA